LDERSTDITTWLHIPDGTRGSVAVEALKDCQSQFVVAPMIAKSSTPEEMASSQELSLLTIMQEPVEPVEHAAAGRIHAANVKLPIPSYVVPLSAAVADWVDPLRFNAKSTVSEGLARASGTSTHGDDTTRANTDAAASSIDIALDARERKEQETVVNVVVVVWWWCGGGKRSLGTFVLPTIQKTFPVVHYGKTCTTGHHVGTRETGKRWKTDPAGPVLTSGGS
jgi:hypothetical protein